MRVQAKNLDASPWVREGSNHQRMLDTLRMGDPHLAEQRSFTSRASFSRQLWPSGHTKSKDNEQHVARGGCLVVRPRYFCLRSNCISDFPPYFQGPASM